MSKLIIILVALITFVVLPPTEAVADQKRVSEGLWLTDDRSLVVSVKPCKETLCGTVYWISSEVPPFDEKNPNPTKRKIPMCGLSVLGGFKRLDDNNWIDGTVYISESGETYQAQVHLMPSGNATVRGYIFFPLFGESMTLTPVSKKDYPQCHVPPVKDH